MTGEENDILKKLTAGLRVVGVSPIPESSFLLERISARIERKQLADRNYQKLNFTPEVNFASPVCFAKSDEVQAEYLNEEEVLRLIDDYIDQLILRKVL